jgi:hypothetical protein
MGIRVETAPHLLRLMSVEDQQRYGGQLNLATTAAVPRLNSDPAPKRDADERKEQSVFANWLMLQDLPFVWHRTDKRTGCNVGCPNFIAGIQGRTYWIEFKRRGFKLSPDQEKFRQRLEAQSIRLHLCYSAAEASQTVQEAAAVWQSAALK